MPTCGRAFFNVSNAAGRGGSGGPRTGVRPMVTFIQDNLNDYTVSTAIWEASIPVRWLRIIDPAGGWFIPLAEKGIPMTMPVSNPSIPY